MNTPGAARPHGPPARPVHPPPSMRAPGIASEEESALFRCSRGGRASAAEGDSSFATSGPAPLLPPLLPFGLDLPREVLDRLPPTLATST